MQKQKKILGNFIFFTKKKLIYELAFGTASVHSWSLDQPLVPGVLNLHNYFLRRGSWFLPAL